MADLVQDTEWQGKALELRTTGLGTSEIGEAVGKHPATIRRLFARNPESEAPDRVLSSEEASEAFAEPQEDPNATNLPPEPHPGQTTVDDFTDSCEHGVPVDEVCGDCGDCDFGDEKQIVPSARDPLEDFRAEAGEAVGPMPAAATVTREMDEGEEVNPAIFVQGTRQMALDFGENAAMVTGATLVLKSEKLEAGHFGLGDVIHGSFTARIVATTGAEKFDKDIDSFVAKPTAQVALVTEIEVVASSA